MSLLEITRDDRSAEQIHPTRDGLIATKSAILMEFAGIFSRAFDQMCALVEP